MLCVAEVLNLKQFLWKQCCLPIHKLTRQGSLAIKQSKYSLLCSKCLWFETKCVQATDHASKMGYQLLIPLCCNQWSKGKGESWDHTYLLFTWMNSQSSWDQPGWDALWEIWLWIIECLLTIYVCSAPVLMGCNVFWIFVVTMLLNMKSFLIVTKQLVFFFAQKSVNNLPHQMFF